MLLRHCSYAWTAYPRGMFTQLRSFLAVIEEGSLNRAAGRLRISQPALTRQIQALEREIGGRLFERTSAGVKPTDAGHALAASMRGIFTEYDAAIADARRLAQGERERLRIGYLGSTARIFLNPALAALRQAYPTVKVQLRDLSPGEQLAALRAGEIDVALVGQEGSVAGRDFYTRKLAAMPMVVILPADHRLARRRDVRLEELREESFVGAGEVDMPGRDRWITQLCRKAGFSPKFVHRATSVSHMFSLVSGEGAITLGPAYLRDFPAAGIATAPLADEGATWDFLVAWQRGRTAGSLQALLEALAGVVQEVCDAERAEIAKQRKPARKNQRTAPMSN